MTEGTICTLRLGLDDGTTQVLPQLTDVRLDSAGEGRFEIELTEACELSLISALPFRRTLVSALVQSLARASGEYEIIVGDCVELRGIVTDEEDRPVTWMYVREQLPEAWLNRVRGADPTRRRWRFSREPSETDSTGKFSYTAVWVPGAVLEVVDEEFSAASIALPERDRTDLRFVIPSEKVSGVLVRSDGTPVYGAVIFDGPKDVTTDEHGRFALAPRSRIGASESLRLQDGTGKAVKFVNFGARWRGRDPSREFRIVCDGVPHAIHGELRTAHGEPAVGWSVDVTQWPEPTADADHFVELHPSGAQSDAAGRFVLKGLELGDHTLFIGSPDAQIGWRRSGIASGEAVTILHIPADAVVPLLRGRVVTDDGTPVAGVRVCLDTRDWGGDVITVGKKIATTDGDGRFEARAVSRTETWVQVLVDDGLFQEGRRKSLVVEPGDRTTIRVGRAARVVFERRRFDPEGNFIVVFDAQDRVMECRQRVGSLDSPSFGSDLSTQLWIRGDRVGEFTVGAHAHHISIYSEGGEVARVPVHLQPGILNHVVWAQ
ncbi:MAG: carboxypeptidase regulatory-like domain-containing protein [Planctomycetes bacterium]|nr:carboxypeptidase regulatory-like domain-containing protein [Planctomycetota bacterium]